MPSSTRRREGPLRSCSRARRGSGSRRSGCGRRGTRARTGLRVLSSRPAEAERALAHVGLGDLFEGVLDDVLPALSAPRRRALEVALLREEALGRARRSAARLPLRCATRCSFSASVGRSLIAVDDVQWLDPSSSSALAFALRRLDGATACSCSSPGGWSRARSRRRSSKRSIRNGSSGCRVGPLSVGALHRFLRDRLGRPFARQTLLRIHERSGGNPFFALELARVLDADVDPLQPLPVPETLEELVRARLAGLPAADARSARARLGLGHGVGVAPRARGRRGDALDAGVRRARDRARERDDPLHAPAAVVGPLPGSSAKSGATFTRRIAAIVDDPLLRARHLALSTDTPDADVAAVLDDAATLGGRSRRVGGRGRARRARASADAARTRATSATDGRSQPLVRISPPGSGRAHARSPTDLLAEAEIGPLRAEALAPPRRVRARRPRRSGSRGGAARGGVAPGAPGAHPHPPRLGGTLQEGIRGGARGHACAHSSSPTVSTTTPSASRRSCSSRGSAAWSATPRRRRTRRGRCELATAAGDAAPAAGGERPLSAMLV